MKRLMIVVVIITIFSFAGCDITGTDDDNGDDTPQYTDVSDSVIFAVPDSIKGDSSRGQRAITASSKDIVDGFYDYARFQIELSDTFAQFIKSLINSLESAEVFTYEEDFTVTLSDTENSGDVVKWTVGENDSYMLEWWKKQSDDTFKKYLELDFSKYLNGETFLARGHIILFVSANENISVPEGFQKNPDWVKVEFDTNYNDTDTKWMKIAITGYQVNGLDPTQSGLTAADYENSIIELTKSSNSEISITGCTYVPGTTHLTYNNTEYENRFYIYSGMGTSDKATVKLAMPKDSYDYSTVFSQTSNTIGAVIQEWYADSLRDNYDSSSDSDVLYLLDFYDYLSLDRTVTNTDPAYPATSTIVSAVSNACTDNPDNEYLENADYLMSVSNPAYFTTTGYSSFGDTVPDGYYTASELPEFSVTETEITGLEINFNTPGDTPPAVD